MNVPLPPGSPARVDTRHLAGHHVLVVDDVVENRSLLSRILGRWGLKISEAVNGLEAVERVQADASIEVVLMDVQMPVMDGVEASRRIRMLPGGESLHIIAVTAGVLEEEVLRLREAGVGEVLAKPISIAVLLQMLLKVWPPEASA